MCLFPLPNNDFTGLAYKKGVTEFDCGACPECLQKRSSQWALRAVYEAKCHAYNCMITLTYDNFIRDKNGKILGEAPVNRDLHVNKRDIQLFIKRLRKWYSSISDEKIKYIACAEYGTRTHRAHYHLILFGVRFPDVHFYKKSKRGNVIYQSNKLSSLWKNGICTVDSINVHAGVARYCTKYCAKSRSDDTFMLCSQGIGLKCLLDDFNGKSYFIDGREYPVPRIVWNHYIMQKYSSKFSNMDFRYLNKVRDMDGFLINEEEFNLNNVSRSIFRAVRDSDPLYFSYLDFWSKKSDEFNQLKLKPLNRLYLLSEKYHFYKVKALETYFLRKTGVPVVAPGSHCFSAYFRWYFQHGFITCPKFLS